MGPSKAKELMFTGSKVGAAVALQIGLVDHVVDEGQAYAKWVVVYWFTSLFCYALEGSADRAGGPRGRGPGVRQVGGVPAFH